MSELSVQATDMTSAKRMACAIAFILVMRAGSPADAGVMVTWGGQQPTINLDVAFDSGASSASDSMPIGSDLDRSAKQAPLRAQRASVFGCARHSPGGASSPAGSSTGRTTTSAAIASAPACLRPVSCTFSGVGEHSPQLPHVPPDELLHPPR